MGVSHDVGQSDCHGSRLSRDGCCIPHQVSDWHSATTLECRFCHEAIKGVASKHPVVFVKIKMAKER